MKFFRASSCVKILKFCNVSGTESVPETLENFNILTQLIARENFIEFCRSENIKKFSYVFQCISMLATCPSEPIFLDIFFSHKYSVPT